MNANEEYQAKRKAINDAMEDCINWCKENLRKKRITYQERDDALRILVTRKKGIALKVTDMGIVLILDADGHMKDVPLSRIKEIEE